MDLAKGHPIRRQPTHLEEDPTQNEGQWPVSYTQNYTIPNDNPFLDVGGSKLEEFYSIGLRHPWTIWYDTFNGDIWAADVGQNKREEITKVSKGDNNQWAYLEGTSSGMISTPSTIIGNQRGPVFEYDNSLGNAVIGAGIYRGSLYPQLYDKYLFSDFISGRLWSATALGGSNDYDIDQIGQLSSGFGGGINSYLLDSQGNILMAKTNGPLNSNGQIQKLEFSGNTTQNPEPPALLSQTGAFTDLANLVAHPGCLSYDFNVPFWSDGAIKTRLLCLPNDGSHNTAAEQITFSENDLWSYPLGTVFIKNFEMDLDETDPLNAPKRLETRFIVRATDGHYAVTYRWNDQGTDADLMTGGADADADTNSQSSGALGIE